MSPGWIKQTERRTAELKREVSGNLHFLVIEYYARTRDIEACLFDMLFQACAVFSNELFTGAFFTTRHGTV